MPSKKPKTATERLRSSRAWPKNVPMPKAGAYSANSRWTYDEEQLLRKNYARYGAQYCARLLGRSVEAIRNRASQIGVAGPGNIWSDRDIERLRRWFRKKPDAELASLLGRSVVSLTRKATALGLITSRNWSQEHRSYLRKHYAHTSFNELVSVLGRTEKAIRGMAHIMGLAREPKGLRDAQVQFIMKNVDTMSFNAIAAELGVNPWVVARAARKHGYRERRYRTDQWTPQEDAYLRENWPTMLAREIAPTLGRSVEGVINRAQKIGIRAGTGRYALSRKWSAKDDRTIRSLYGKISRAKIAESLGRTKEAVKSRIDQLGLHTEAAQSQKWSRKEDALLRELYPTLGIQAIAFRLQKSTTAVRMRITKLELGDDLTDAPWTAREEAELRKLYPLYNNREIGRRLGRSLGSIQHRARRLGLSKPPELKAHPWSQREDATLKRLFGTVTSIEIARRMNRSIGSVRARLQKFELKKYTRRRSLHDR